MASSTGEQLKEVKLIAAARDTLVKKFLMAFYYQERMSAEGAKEGTIRILEWMTYFWFLRHHTCVRVDQDKHTLHVNTELCERIARGGMAKRQLG